MLDKFCDVKTIYLLENALFITHIYKIFHMHLNIAGNFVCVREGPCNLNVLHKMYIGLKTPSINVITPFDYFSMSELHFTNIFCYFMHERSLLSLFNTKQKDKKKFVCTKCCYIFHVGRIKYQMITATS